MRILIASGIFEPDGGGPATYVPRLAQRLSEAGHKVTVVAFSNKTYFESDKAYTFSLKRILRGSRIGSRVRFLRALLQSARDADLIYSLDWYGVGILVTIAAYWRRISYIVRVGGDYVWEQRYLDRASAPLPLAQFYETGAYRSYRIPFYLIRFVLSHASHVVFNTDREKKLYEQYFGIKKSFVIHNPVPTDSVATIRRGEVTHEFVFWGRFTAMKNIESLVRAFAKAKLPDTYKLVLIGDGPRFEPVRMLVNELGVESRVEMIKETRFDIIMERVKNARAFVLPSWTDISPTQVYEALAIGLPALVTKETYLPIRDQLPDMLDPQSVDDIAAKLEMLADDARYEDFAKQFRSISFNWSWSDAANAHIELFKKVLYGHG